MGDRAPGCFTVYTCPNQWVANEILALADEYAMGYEWGAMGMSSPSDLRLGKPLTDDEMSLGNDDFIARRLANLGVVAKVEQDAKYEYDATVYLVHPELGRFDATGTQSGEVMIPASVLYGIIDNGLVSVGASDWPEAIYKLTGKAWSDAIASAEKALAEPDAVTVWTFVDEDELFCIERRADSIEDNDVIMEPGLEPVFVKRVMMHGDTVLLTGWDKGETSLDRDAVVWSIRRPDETDD